MYTDFPTSLPTQAPTQRIVGWLPAGMLDWPGRVAVTVFMSGCDFSCPFCHNPQLIPTENRSSDHGNSEWADLRKYLRRRKAWIDGVVIGGGEPTLDPDIVYLLEALAAEGIAVKLDTNGSDPNLLGRLISDGLLAAVAVDVKTTFDRYDRVTQRADAADKVAQTINLVRDSGIPHEFRTTVYPDVIPPSDLPTIAASLSGGDLYVLQQFRPQRTLDTQAALVQPVPPDILRACAADCSAYIPTITRGV